MTAAPSRASVRAITAPVLIPAPVTIATSPANADAIAAPPCLSLRQCRGSRWWFAHAGANPRPACGESVPERKRGRVRGTFGGRRLTEGPPYPARASALATLSPQAGRGFRTRGYGLGPLE